MPGLQPAASASQSAVQGAHEHDAEDRVPGAGRQFLGAGDEISGGIVDQHVERSFFPDGVDHPFDGVEAAHVAGECVAWAFGREFSGGLLENFFTAAADVDDGAEFEEALGHALAEAGAAAGDQDALVLEKIGAEHLNASLRISESDGKLRVPHRLRRFGMTNYRGWEEKSQATRKP